MTLEALIKQYERLSEMSEKRGHMYYNDAEDARQKGNYESAMQYYNMASAAFNEATFYIEIVDDLNNVT